MNASPSTHWARLRSLLDRALELEGSQQDAFVNSLENDDAALRDELRAWLAKHAKIVSVAMPDAMQMAVPAVARLVTQDSTLDEARLGRTIGQYRLVKMLGAGGMGVVYLAERCASGFAQQVALKLVRGAFDEPAARDRFARERQILAGLAHPAIAALLDGGQTEDGHAYYTMEFVDGVPVTTYCDARACSVDERLALLLRVAGAISYAHQHLIVHRDIKPSNVLVTAAGEVKLVDFGLAKPLDGAATLDMTQLGAGPMTPGFAAPEQFNGGAISVATDVYQFGVLCFVVLTGKLPYRGDPNALLEWARSVAEEEPMRLARAAALSSETGASPSQRHFGKLRRQLTRDLDAIVRKALAKSSNARYRSMDALIADLESFLARRPVTAHKAGPFYFAWRFAQRWRYAVAASVMAVVLLAATAVIAIRQSFIAEAQAASAKAAASFLISLFQVSDPGVNRGERLTANQILERGAARIENEMIERPEQRAQLLETIGEVYESMGDFQRAEKPLASAVAALRVAPSPDPLEFGHDMHRLAWALFRQGKTDATLDLLDQAEATISQSDAPRVAEEMVIVRTMRALALADKGEYAEAEQEFRTLFDSPMSEGLRKSEAVASAHNNFASVLNYEEKLSEALRENEQARDLFRAVLGDDHFKTMSATSNLGNTLVVLHQYDRAFEILAPLAEQQNRILGESNASYAIVLNLLGLVAGRRGEYDRAFQYFSVASDIFRRVLGERHRNVAFPIAYAGDVELERGHRESALALEDAALDIRRAALPGDHPDIAFSYYARSRVFLSLGRPFEAKWDAEDGLAIRRSHYPANSFLIRDSLAEFGLSRYASDDFVGAFDAWTQAAALEQSSSFDAGRHGQVALLIGNPDLAQTAVVRFLPAEP